MSHYSQCIRKPIFMACATAIKRLKHMCVNRFIAFLSLVLAGRFAAFSRFLGLLLRGHRLRCLKNSPRQPFKVLACLLTFVVFVFLHGWSLPL